MIHYEPTWQESNSFESIIIIIIIIIIMNQTTSMHITKLYPYILAFRTSRPETAQFPYC
jgi:hypothetical protein